MPVLGFKARVDPALAFSLACNGFLRFTSDVTPANRLHLFDCNANRYGTSDRPDNLRKTLLFKRFLLSSKNLVIIQIYEKLSI